MNIQLYQNDLPDEFEAGNSIAIDTETMGLNPFRDRLCLVQISTGDDNAHLIQISKNQKTAPNLSKILANPNILKIFHFGRFDIAALAHRFGVLAKPVYCTKIASKLVRTYTDRHGLSSLTSQLLNIEISKQQQSSDWGAEVLTSEQQNYAASDVLYLHKLMEELNLRLEREQRMDLANACFDFLPTRAKLDLEGWPEIDIFAH